MSAYEQYKSFIQNDPNISSLRKQVQQIVLQRKLSSIMNDTKWLELQQAVQSLPFPPAYVVKLLTENDVPTVAHIPDYWGDWGSFYQEGLPPFFNIEWMRVAPRYARHRGQLVADEVVDITEAFRDALYQYNIPHEEADGIITIYGYK